MKWETFFKKNIHKIPDDAEYIITIPIDSFQELELIANGLSKLVKNRKHKIFLINKPIEIERK